MNYKRNKLNGSVDSSACVSTFGKGRASEFNLYLLLFVCFINFQAWTSTFRSSIPFAALISNLKTVFSREDVM